MFLQWQVDFFVFDKADWPDSYQYMTVESMANDPVWF